jgi:hypothetical protein
VKVAELKATSICCSNNWASPEVRVLGAWRLWRIRRTREPPDVVPQPKLAVPFGTSGVRFFSIAAKCWLTYCSL